MRVIDEAGAMLVEADQTQLDRLGIALPETGVMAPNLLARRVLLEEVGGFHPAFQLAQDLDLVLRLAQLGEFVFVDGRWSSTAHTPVTPPAWRARRLHRPHLAPPPRRGHRSK